MFTPFLLNEIQQFKKLKMKRLLLSLITILLVSLMSKADNKVLQIWQADGQIVTISLNEEPRTTYSDGNLVITTTKTTITYPLEQVWKYTYVLEGSISEGDGVPDGIKSILSEDGETLTFKGLKAGTEVLLYSASGQLVRRLSAANDNNVAVSVSLLPTGVYIVKANNATYKITKR